MPPTVQSRHTHPATPYALLALPALLLLLFLVWPALHALWMSTHDYTQLYQPQWVGWANYNTLLHLPQFTGALIHTAWLVLVVVPALVTLPLVLALVLNQRLWGIELLRAVIYLPVITSLVVVGITWKWLMASNGLLNQWLTQAGWPAVGWLTDPNVVMLSLALVVIWKALPYYAMMYLAQLQSLAKHHYEAAELDGANLIQQHCYITLPLMQPTMVLVGLISLIGALKTFTEIYVMTRGGPLHASETLVYVVYQWAFERLDLGLASAAGLVLALLLITFSLVQLIASRTAEAAQAGAETTPPPLVG
jgi:putative chitobiose transport system permease protein